MAIVSSQPITAKNLFSFVRNVKAPKTGDLREPVTFYRSHRLPIRDPATGQYTDDEEQDITPYHNAFAFVWQDQTAALDGQNTVNTVSHVFIVRNFPGFQPETRDGLLWKGSMYSVAGTRNLQEDPLHRFLIVICQQEGRYTDEPRTNTRLPAGDPLSEYVGGDGEDGGDPLWM